jgi:hypothetical protein
MKNGSFGSGVPRWLEPGSHESLRHGENTGVR